MGSFKNILVPTDFSEYAESAVRTAVEICRKSEARLHLFHCASLPIHWNNWSPREQIAFEKLQSEDVLLEEIDRAHQVAKYSDLRIRNHVRNGNLIPALKNTSDQLNIDLIVMGTHGASGKEEYFIGSNTQKVIRKLHRSILIIKEDIKPASIEKIAYITGPKGSNKESFERFLKFIKLFAPSELHLVSVALPGHLLQPVTLLIEDMKILASQVTDLRCHLHIIPQFTVDAGVRQFVHDNNIELIGISNHDRHPIKRIFTGSNVEFLANHLLPPLISIDF